MRYRFVAIILPLVALALASTLLWLDRDHSPAAKGKTENLPTFSVRQGPLTIDIAESGTIKAREQEILKSEVEGRTTILSLVPEGTPVRKGDLLVELDSSQLQEQLVDQKTMVETAEADFVQAREGLAVVENQVASDIEKAELAFRFAQEDSKKYLDGDFPKERKEAEARIAMAKAELHRTEGKAKWSRIRSATISPWSST